MANDFKRFTSASLGTTAGASATAVYTVPSSSSVAMESIVIGITLANKFVILDEAQNATPEQIKMFVTRLGEGSRYIITGDLAQSDIKRGMSGLEDAIKRFAGVHGVGLAQFKEKDIVRHSLVRRLLKRYKDSFQIMDEVSAEKTISMWIHENGLDIPNDGSIDDTFYKIKK